MEDFQEAEVEGAEVQETLWHQQRFCYHHLPNPLVPTLESESALPTSLS